LYPVRVNHEISGLSQKEAYGALQETGIFVNLHYIPVYRHPYYEAMGFRAGYCPEAEQYFRESLSLPIYPAMSDEQKSEVITKVRKVIAG
jgi:dTDP-4-amino-4,6-dideoxygalactose transaminase